MGILPPLHYLFNVFIDHYNDSPQPSSFQSKPSQHFCSCLCVFSSAPSSFSLCSYEPFCLLAYGCLSWKEPSVMPNLGQRAAREDKQRTGEGTAWRGATLTNGHFYSKGNGSAAGHCVGVPMQLAQPMLSIFIDLSLNQRVINAIWLQQPLRWTKPRGSSSSCWIPVNHGVARKATEHKGRGQRDGSV